MRQKGATRKCKKKNDYSDVRNEKNNLKVDDIESLLFPTIPTKIFNDFDNIIVQESERSFSSFISSGTDDYDSASDDKVCPLLSYDIRKNKKAMLENHIMGEEKENVGDMGHSLSSYSHNENKTVGESKCEDEERIDDKLKKKEESYSHDENKTAEDMGNSSNFEETAHRK